MTIAVCAVDSDRITIRKGLIVFEQMSGYAVRADEFKRREDLLYRMRDKCYDAVFVAFDGALGMETALGVRDMDAAMPLIWASDDRDFALESYRLHARLFLHKPITVWQVAEALGRCCGRLTERGGKRHD